MRYLIAAIGALIAYADQKPSVTLAGIGATGAKLTTSSGKFSFSYPLEATADVTGLTVAVDSFHGPNDTTFPATVTLDAKPANTPVDVKQSDRPFLRIAGEFPYAGDYISNIVIRLGDERQASIPVVVTRQWNALGVQVQLVDTVRAAPAWPWLSADATVRFTVKESGGKTVTIYAPKVTQLALKRGDKEKVQARYSKAELQNQKSGFSFAPQESREYVMKISGLEDPGEYSGVITLGSADTTPVDTTFTVFAKKGGLTAFLFIFAGVVAAYLIRRWTGEMRPRLDLERRAANLRDDLELVEKNAAPLPLGAARAFDGLRQQLGRLERDIEQGASGDRKPALDEMNGKISKLPPWLTLGNELAAVDPAATVQKQIDDWKALAGSYFLEPGAKVEAIDKAIPEIRAAMKEALKAAMVRRVDELLAAITAYKSAHPATKMGEAEKLSGQARKSAEAGDMDATAATLRSARFVYAKQAAGALNNALSHATPPAGFTPQTWADLGTKLRAKIPEIAKEPDPAKAIALFEEVNAAYIEEIILRLEALAGELEPQIEPNGHLAPETKDSLKKTLGEGVTSLKGARTSLESGDGNAALAGYRIAADKIKDANKQLADTGVLRLGAGKNIAAAIADFFAPMPQPLVIHEARAVADRPVREISIAEKLTDKIWRYDLLLNAGLLVIATVLGLKLLWADNATWGSAGDYAVAFLWGLGLQQVGGAGFEGLPAVLKKVTG